jgi:hypothetical protein
MELSKQMFCQKCGEITTVTLARNITHAGAYNIFWLCNVCHDNASGSAKWIPHAPIKEFGIDIETIPVHKDGRVEVCAICGGTGVDWHHWAPRHLFGDECEEWPGAWLCRHHHQYWHDKTTPNMSKVKR